VRTIARKTHQQFGRRAVAAALTAVMLVQSSLVAADDLNTQAQRLFNDLGAMGNITRPQAFKGQTMNTYTSGSLFVRAPQKTYQLASLQMPYISAGCGGINLYGGSFSHISGAAFKDMLKSITSAIPGVIFQLAIKSVEPLLGSTIDEFKTWEDLVNNRNISSCEAAKWLVGKAGDAMGMSTQSACQSIATDSLGLDAEESRDRCNKGNGTDSVLNDSRGDKRIPPFQGNLMWDALLRMKHLDDTDRQLVMSITGTTIFPRTSTDTSPDAVSIPPTITALKDLMYGNSDSLVTAPGFITVKLLKCDELTECRNPYIQDEVTKSMIDRVGDLMQSLSDKIYQGNVEPNAQEVNFVNAVPLPVYQMLSVANAAKNEGIPIAKINQYKEYVAVEFAHALLSRLAGIGFSAGVMNRFKLTAVQESYLRDARENAQSFLRTVQEDRAEASKRAANTVQIANDIEQMQRAIRANMPQQVADMLSYNGVR
jgi:conjugative transfer pilus assembly protein TraH